MWKWKARKKNFHWNIIFPINLTYTGWTLSHCGDDLENAVNLGICGILGNLNCGNFGRWKAFGAISRGILCLFDFLAASTGDWWFRFAILLFVGNIDGGAKGAGRFTGADNWCCWGVVFWACFLSSDILALS